MAPSQAPTHAPSPGPARPPRLSFHKYHGTGNDFIVLAEGAYPSDRASVARLCAPHRGVGADGILFYSLNTGEESGDEGGEAGYDARMVIHNQDGSRPQMCGNGVRCLARHLVEVEGLSPRIRVLSDAGVRTCEVHRGHDGNPWQVTVDMGPPRFERDVEPLEFEGRTFRWFAVNMGNPHAVIFEWADEGFADRIGAWANAAHPQFPEGVNVEFVERLGERHLRVLVYERGVGRTQACGTGACAVAVAAWREGICTPGAPVRVDLPGGPLLIEERDATIWMTGPAVAVFRGELAPDWPPDDELPTGTAEPAR